MRISHNLLVSVVVPVGLIIGSFTCGMLTAVAHDPYEGGPSPEMFTHPFEYRVKELERKVGGMQQQITRLHAIREAQDTRICKLEKQLKNTRESLTREIVRTRQMRLQLQ